MKSWCRWFIVLTPPVLSSSTSPTSTVSRIASAKRCCSAMVVAACLQREPLAGQLLPVGVEPVDPLDEGKTDCGDGHRDEHRPRQGSSPGPEVEDAGDARRTPGLPRRRPGRPGGGTGPTTTAPGRRSAERPPTRTRRGRSARSPRCRGSGPGRPGPDGRRDQGSTRTTAVMPRHRPVAAPSSEEAVREEPPSTSSPMENRKQTVKPSCSQRGPRSGAAAGQAAGSETVGEAGSRRQPAGVRSYIPPKV